MRLLFSLLFAILPTCHAEDNTWCKWDAEDNGNGIGTDFVTINIGPAFMTLRPDGSYSYWVEPATYHQHPGRTIADGMADDE